MRQYAVLFVTFFAGIILYGCGSKDMGPHENISFSDKEPKSLEYIGTRNITWGDTTVNIPWYRLDADYNTTQTDEFWQKIPVPSKTVSTYIGRYGSVQWCEWDDDGETMFESRGLEFIVPDEYIVPPGPGMVNVRWWLYIELNSSGRMSFKYNRYYVFCLDRQPVEQWINGANEASCDMDSELAHIIAIIEINPTFDYRTLSASSPIHLTEENLRTFRETSSISPEEDFEIVKADNHDFKYLIPERYGNLFVKPLFIKKLLYTINNCIWTQNKIPHQFKRPVIGQTIFEYIDNDGLMKKVVFEYDDGIWYIEHPKNKYYSINPPFLFWEVRDEARHDLDIFIADNEIKSNPENVKAWSHRGYLHYEAWETEKACFDYKRVCELGDCSDFRSRCLDASSTGIEKFIDQNLLTKIAVKDEDERVRRASVEKLRSKVLLSKIAVEDKSSDVRRSATKKLNDQTLLARIAVEDEDEYVRSTAIENINDQALLSKIAFEDKSPEVRRSATKKLTDHVLLARVALEDKEQIVRSTAIENIDDQALLSKIAVKDKVPYVRSAATNNLLDQGLLAKIAVEDSQDNVRNIAAEKLTDQSLLQQIAVEDKSPKVRRTATKKLADQSLLARIALTDKDGAVQKTAAARVIDTALLSDIGMWIKPKLTSQVTDHALLEKIAVEAKDDKVRLAAVKSLTNQALLGKVAMEDKDWIVRSAAVENINDQALLLKIALEDTSSVASDAIKRLTDQNLIAKVAMETKDVFVSIEAMDKLTDQALLAKIALDGKELDIRETAVENLIDQELLMKIALTGKDWAVRVAALKALAWQRPDETTLKFIEDRARQDESSEVRGEAAKIIAEKWSNIKK